MATCGGRIHTEVTAYDEMPNLLTTRPQRTSNARLQARDVPQFLTLEEMTHTWLIVCLLSMN